MRRLLLGLLLALAPAWTGAQRPLGVQPPRPLDRPADALSFLVVGDWGRQGEALQRAVAAAMARAAQALDIEGVISTGDNIYPNGVASTRDPLWRTSFEAVYAAHALQVEWWVVLGNHDYRGNPQAQVDYSGISRRWRLPSRYYTKVFAVDDTTQLQVWFLDTSPFIASYRAEPDKYGDVAAQDTAAQRRWLDSTLAASRAPWKLVVGHHHIYSGGKRGTNADLEGFLVPRLRRWGVAAYVNGHEHVLQHIVRPDAPTPHYFISGAGSEVRAPGSAAGTRYAEGRSGFLALSFTAGTLQAQFVDFTGQVRYRTTVPRPTAPIAQPAPAR